MKRLLILAFSAINLFTGCEELDPREPGLLVPRTADEDSSIPSIAVNNTILHAESFGDPSNPMIVVVHGGPGTDYRYLLNCKELVDYGYYVVFYDQRGTGLSQRVDQSSISMQVMLDDLTGVIAHFRSSADQKVVILGQSWGAMLATAYINEYPTSVDGLILGEPGGLVWDDVTAYVSRSRDYGIGSEALSDAMYVDQFITGKEDQHEILDYRFVLLSSSAPTDGPLGNEGPVPFWRYGYILNKALSELGEQTEPDWTTNLQAFDTEVLFVYSENNRAYGREHAQHVSSAYPNVRLEEIKDAGHDMLTFETGWNNFLPLALDYLNDLGI